MSTHTITTQKVTFKVFRFNADTDYLPHYQEITMDVTSEEVVLDITNCRMLLEHREEIGPYGAQSDHRGIWHQRLFKKTKEAVTRAVEELLELVDGYDHFS